MSPRPPQPPDHPHLFLSPQPRILQISDILQESPSAGSSLAATSPRTVAVTTPRAATKPLSVAGSHPSCLQRHGLPSGPHRVMLVSTCAWLRDKVYKEALDTAHGQPLACRRTPPPPTALVATAGGEKPAKVAADNIHKRWCRRHTDKDECEM